MYNIIVFVSAHDDHFAIEHYCPHRNNGNKETIHGITHFVSREKNIANTVDAEEFRVGSNKETSLAQFKKKKLIKRFIIVFATH